jgi:hypothetical protein
MADEGRPAVQQRMQTGFFFFVWKQELLMINNRDWSLLCGESMKETQCKCMVYRRGTFSLGQHSKEVKCALLGF